MRLQEPQHAGYAYLSLRQNQPDQDSNLYFTIKWDPASKVGVLASKLLQYVGDIKGTGTLPL